MALNKADLDDETLASEEELELMSLLRKELEPELSALKAKGTDFPHITGDIFMTRVLRGNDRDVQLSSEWYRKFMILREEHGLDAIHQTCEAAGLKWKADAMPHAEEVLKHYTMAFDEDELRSQDGHLIWFDACGLINAAGLLANVDKVKEFFRFAVERRMSVLDRLSKEQGRLVKIVRIMDTEGMAPWRLQHTWSFIFPLGQQTSIEVLHRLYLINSTWFAMKMYGLFKPLLAERVQRRVNTLDGNFMQDAKLLSLVLGAKLVELQAGRRSDFDDGAALEGSNRLIEAGGMMTRSFSVKEGQRVSWEFGMGSSNDGEGVAVRGFAGKVLDKSMGEATDVKFSVGFWPEGGGVGAGAGGGEAEAEPDDVGFLEQTVLVPKEAADAKQGAVTGTSTMPGAGTVCLTWSNQSSWVRAKLVATYKVVLE